MDALRPQRMECAATATGTVGRAGAEQVGLTDIERAYASISHNMTNNNDLRFIAARSLQLENASVVEDFSRLVPELPDWNDGQGIDIDSWAVCIARPDHLIGYARILWPNFILHDDCVFRGQDFSDDNYRVWLTQMSGDKSAVERVLNHIHISAVFGDPEIGVSEDQACYIANLLREMWSAKLQYEYPHRRFVVAVVPEGPRGPIDYQVTFAQVRE